MGEGRRTHRKLSREVEVLPEGRGGRGHAFREAGRGLWQHPCLNAFRLE